MKLLDVMKKYDRCVVRESAKLTKIYNLLLKESEDADNIEEAEVCPDCGEDPCVCESGKEVDTTEKVNEDDSNVMTAEEFFSEADEEAEELSDDHRKDVKETEEEVDEDEEMMSAEQFFSEAEGDIHEYELEFDFDDGTGSGNKTDKVEASSLEDAISKLEANGYGSITKVYYASEDGKEISLDEDDAEGKEEVAESDEMMSAEQFFAEADEEAEELSDDHKKDVEETEEEVDEDEEMMSAEQFFAEADEEAEELSDDYKKDVEETEEEVDEAEEDIDEDEKEKKLEESLKSYRRANHRLFNN